MFTKATPKEEETPRPANTIESVQTEYTPRPNLINKQTAMGPWQPHHCLGGFGHHHPFCGPSEFWQSDASSEFVEFCGIDFLLATVACSQPLDHCPRDFLRVLFGHHERQPDRLGKYAGLFPDLDLVFWKQKMGSEEIASPLHFHNLVGRHCRLCKPLYPEKNKPDFFRAQQLPLARKE